jgi:hypothetical protein
LLQTGTIVAGYRIDGELGEGGMAVVYRATQLSLERVVALKVLAAQLSDDPGFRRRFQREGQLQASLDHPHIVTVYEAGQTEQGLFLAMRLIQGPTLKDLILQRELDPRRALRLLAQVAQALDSAHELGLIHRDIKPQNILIGREDHAYLADFGLIKSPDDAGLTGTGQFIGTIDYVSPEQIQGEPATSASDIYGLAAVLYECLTGQVPFPRQNEAATVHAHVVEPPPRVSEQRPELPTALDDVIAAGMAKDPAARPASATELIRSVSLAFTSGSSQAGTAAQATRLSPSAGAADREQATVVPGAGPTFRRAAPAASDATRRSDRPAGAPPAPAGARARGARAAMVAIPLAVAALAGGFLVGNSNKSTTSLKLANRATVGHLRLSYPGGWQLGAPSPRIPGMTFTDPFVLSPTPSSAALQAGAVAGAGGPTLLSPSFRARLAAPAHAATPVRLGGIDAYRYAGLTVRGLAGNLTVFAAPTSAGVTTVTCWASGGAPRGFQEQCAKVAATAMLIGASAYPLGPSTAYASLLTATVKRLDAAITGPAAGLRAARTPKAQASAAASIEAAYRRAASRLRAAAITPEAADANDALTSALVALAAGYAHAGSAAASNDAAGYQRAAQQIDAGSAALSRAFDQLTKLGYKVG